MQTAGFFSLDLGICVERNVDRVSYSLASQYGSCRIQVSNFTFNKGIHKDLIKLKMKGLSD
jgi:hypothetical protein